MFRNPSNIHSNRISVAFGSQKAKEHEKLKHNYQRKSLPSALNDIQSFPACFMWARPRCGVQETTNKYADYVSICAFSNVVSISAGFLQQMSLKISKSEFQKSHPMPPDMHSQRTTNEQAVETCSVTVMCSSTGVQEQKLFITHCVSDGIPN